jgi:hypothetical protein
MTGSGELGPIVPGWNVQEFATPITIGETSGGTGSVSFNAGARDTSLFIVNNNIATIEESLGSVSGVVKSVSQTGLNVSVTHDTLLSLFDANFDVPALGAGGIVPVIDLASQLSGRDKQLAFADGNFYSMRGHSAGFLSTGQQVSTSINNGSYLQVGTSRTYPVYYREQYGSLWANSFTTFDNEIWATRIYGDCFSNNRALNTSLLAFKTKLSSGSVVFSSSAATTNSSTGTGSQNFSVTIDYASRFMTLAGRYNDAGAITDFNQQYDISSQLDISEELAVFVSYKIPTTGNTYSITVRICNVSDYTTYGQLVQTFSSASRPSYSLPWNIVGNARAVYRHVGQDLAALVPAEYENDVTYFVSSTITLGGPVAAQSKVNLWNYVQDACSAYNKEIALNSSGFESLLMVRDIDTYEIVLDNSSPISVTPTISFAGRNVEVVYTNARHVVNAELYNARNDNNRVLSVKADETIKTTVKIDGTPTLLNVPQRSTVPPAGLNEYCIIHSTGGQVPQELWEFRGGRIIVELNSDIPDSIDITLVGPSSLLESDGYLGPYKVAYSSGDNDYAALSIVGTGVLYNLKTAKILTAADPDKTSQDIAKTIKNPFINTKTEAYDRGINAVIQASGPNVRISGTISVASVDGFGLVAGSRIRYRDSIYRVTDATIGNLGISFNAVRHVTVDDFDSLWAGHNVSLHDGLWDGYDTSDHVIRPLWFVGDNESVLMFLDTDTNPYYDFDGEPEISVFRDDTDNNPYYEDGGNLEGEDPIFLDTDDNPYDGNV